MLRIRIRESELSFDNPYMYHSHLPCPRPSSGGNLACAENLTKSKRTPIHKRPYASTAELSCVISYADSQKQRELERLAKKERREARNRETMAAAEATPAAPRSGAGAAPGSCRTICNCEAGGSLMEAWGLQ